MDTNANELSGGTFGSKISALVETLKTIGQLGEKAVVFAQWQDLIFKIHSALVKFGIPTAVLAGSAFERASVLQRFEGPDLGVLLLSLEDSASGTNMSHANHVLLVHPMVATSQDEQEAYEAQAVGRVRRWGQKRNVQVWRFVMEGTIEADLAARNASAAADQVRSVA
jgi:SNF2 family DNA or RNA helicase